MFKNTLTKIRKRITNNFIYILVDETTGSRGPYVYSLIVGIFHPEIIPTPFLISRKELKQINDETIYQFMNYSLSELFRHISFQKKILLRI